MTKNLPTYGEELENRIICGDSLEVLKTLPSESIDCCITSPPYFGLRDYGTASWDGGDAECDHIKSTLQSKSTTLASGTIYKSKRQDGVMPFGNVCGKCGAKRQDNTQI
jgi:site-specific DNA-methyltransferase (cytosine-N4-specific)